MSLMRKRNGKRLRWFHTGTSSFKREVCAIQSVRLLTLLALSCLTFAVASARDRSETYSANVDWSSFYVGGHVGFAAIGFDSVFDSNHIGGPLELEDATVGRDFDLDGALGGLNVGWNATRGHFVWGLEASISYLGTSERAVDPEDEGTDGSETDNASVDIDWLASLRGRVGVTSGTTLFFVTAGVAWVDATYSAQNLDNSSSDQGSVWLSGTGFVIGGGIEHAVSDRISVKVEGLYHAFNRRKDTNSLTSDSDAGDFAELKDIAVARLGVNYSLSSRKNNVATRAPSSSPAAWQGVYVGATAGYGVVDFDSVFDVSDITNPGDHEDSVLGRFLDLDGGVFGGYLGYNRLVGRYVVGVEADWNKINSSDLRVDPDGGDPDDDSASAGINWMASLRARLGVTSERSLIYTTAGVAWVDGAYSAQDDGGSDVGTISLNQTGFVVGGGLEHEMVDQIFIRFEVLHYMFGKEFDTRGLTADSDAGDFAKLSDISTARIGLSYKFNSN